MRERIVTFDIRKSKCNDTSHKDFCSDKDTSFINLVSFCIEVRNEPNYSIFFDISKNEVYHANLGLSRNKAIDLTMLAARLLSQIQQLCCPDIVINTVDLTKSLYLFNYKDRQLLETKKN